MARKQKHEEHVNHERYLISYADIMTLLTALFIVLFAMSDVNEEKMKQVAVSFQEALYGEASGELLNLEMGKNPEIRKPTEATPAEMKMMKSVAEQNELRKLKEKIDEKIEEEKIESKVKTEITKDGLKIVLTDEILFESGSAILKKDFLSILKTITVVIQEVDNPVQISGFTDNIPISTARYPSNWELSTDRAVSVLRYILTNDKKIDPMRFSAAGYGEYQPIASNATKEGRETNRRVEILIERMNSEGLLEPNEGGGENEK